MKTKSVFFCCAAAILLFLTPLSCWHSRPITPAGPEFAAASDEAGLNEPEEEKIPRYSLTLLATGDNLFHDSIINTSLKNGAYDFTPIYSEVKSLVEKADLAFINQETVLAGEKFGYSGYPRFNTPQSLAKTLADAGFDIVNHANNHAMDMGEAGMLATLDLWDTMPGITVIGARASGDRFKIIEKNNITLGFLSYTYGLNGIPLPRGNPDLVSIINRAVIAEEIDALRPLCDFLIVSMHWGDEYMLVDPVAAQTRDAALLAEHNVDLIIGHHPHVLQRFESLPRPDGKNTLCFYSLGNFVSNQRGKERILGAMMLVTFIKEGDELSISDSGLIPVVCHFDNRFSNTQVFPLYSYDEEMLKKHQCMTIDGTLSMDFFNSVMNRLGARVIMSDPFSAE